MQLDKYIFMGDSQKRLFKKYMDISSMYYMYIYDFSIHVHVRFCAKTGVSVQRVQTASFNSFHIFHNICVTFSAMDFSKVEQKKVQLSTNFLFYITYNTVYATLLHTTNVKTN